MGLCLPTRRLERTLLVLLAVALLALAAVLVDVTRALTPPDSGALTLRLLQAGLVPALLAGVALWAALQREPADEGS